MVVWLPSRCKIIYTVFTSGIKQPLAILFNWAFYWWATILPVAFTFNAKNALLKI
jgi:hypothetical protein